MGPAKLSTCYGSSIDSEDRKRRSAQGLLRSEFYLAEGQRLANLGSWAFDPAGFDYWSPELFRMQGLGPKASALAIRENNEEALRRFPARLELR
jgi:hypothetical protein